MAAVKVIPGSYLPVSGRQNYTYNLKTPAQKGTLVRINLAGRALRGIVAGPVRAPRGVRLKTAIRDPFLLPAYQMRLAIDVATNYRASLAAVIKLMLPPPGKLTFASDKTSLSDSRANNPKLVLNDEQNKAYRSIRQSFGHYQGFLLYGITGSGKTEIYLKAAIDLLDKGRQAVMLVPEISMSSHLAARLKKFLGEQVIIWHSGRTNHQKRLDWVRLAKGYPALVIGPRSALFLPYPKLGLVVVDEEQDPSYKQDARMPLYHARAVAGLLGQRAICPVVYGSATPSAELWHMVNTGKLEKLTLTKRFGGASLPQIELIDMRGLPQKYSFSQPALDKIGQTLMHKKQTIVLINRRGRAPLLQCRRCGATVRCKKCDRPLVLHGGAGTAQLLACHYCDTRQPVVKSCTQCSDNHFLQLGHGTQSITDELNNIFPHSRVARLDRDTAHSKKRLSRLTRDLQAGRVDILVGTQLVAKGWDLDKLELVVVVDADQGLFIPDFRAHERTLQLLWQVAGRAGRRQNPGTVLIQTRQPDHPALKALTKNSFSAFMRAELKQRKKYGFPPFRRLIKIIIGGRTIKQRQKKDQQLINRLARPQAQSSVHTVALPGADRQRITTDLLKQTTIFPAQELTLPGGGKALQRIIATDNPQKILPAIPAELSVDVDPEDYLA